MDTRWKQYHSGRTPRRRYDLPSFVRDDDWVYRVARYMDMRVNQADYGVNTIPVDLFEIEEGFLIKAPAVGITPGGVAIHCEDDELVIRAKVDESQSEGKVSSRIIGERPHGLFARRLTLPAPVDADQASARIENGLLTIHLPRCLENGFKKVHIMLAEPAGETMAAFD